MKRDLKKYVDEYKTRFYGLKSGKGAIYGTDIEQILSMTNNNFDRIANALEVGIIIGYRLGIREAKKYKNNN